VGVLIAERSTKEKKERTTASSALRSAKGGKKGKEKKSRRFSERLGKRNDAMAFGFLKS